MTAALTSRDEALHWVDMQQRREQTVVFTNGCFDLLHVGHIVYLEAAAQLGDQLIVGLNSDASIRRLKGKNRPIIFEADRARLLKALRMVSWVTIFDEDTPEVLISSIRPDVLVKGGDWPVEKIIGGDFVSSYGGKVIAMPFLSGYSSTRLIDTIVQRYRPEPIR